MRIGIVYDAVYPYVRGGAERRNHEIASRLSAAHDVTVISWQYWDGPQVLVRDGITYHGVGRPPALYGGDGKRRVSEVVGFTRRILPVLLRQRFDVIDCSATPYVPVFAASLAARLTGTPLVVTWHEFWGQHWQAYLPDRRLVARLGRLAEARAARRGDVRVAVSPFTAQRLVEAGVSGSSIRVVGNGVNFADYSRARPDRQRWDVIHVGRLIDEKRVDVLLDAVAQLRNRLANLRCLIVGDGPERDRLATHAARLSLAGVVEFAGHLPDSELRRVLKGTRALALPSVREGFGMVVLEAQAAGVVPVVVRSPHSAAASLIHDGVDGVVCEPTAESLAAGLHGVLADGTRHAVLRRAALAAARERDWDHLAADIERLYMSLAAGGELGTQPSRRLSWR